MFDVQEVTFQRVREYLGQCETDVKWLREKHEQEHWLRLIRLARVLSDCVSMQLTFHEALRKIEREVKLR